MLAKKYHSKIASIKNPIEGLYTIEFESLAGKYKYAPGQFIHLAIDQYDPSDAWPESRCFSIQSSPVEKNLRMTYAVKGSFTQRMEKELRVGDEVWLKLPFGDLFTQEHTKKNTIFIAGGTGVTPYLSLFTNESFAEYEAPVLYTGFRNKTLNLYNTEFEVAQKINAGLGITVFYEDTDGIIDIKRILKESNKGTSFFISGPPAMIKSFKLFLLENGISGEQIKTDDWE